MYTRNLLREWAGEKKQKKQQAADATHTVAAGKKLQRVYSSAALYRNWQPDL